MRLAFCAAAARRCRSRCGFGLLLKAAVAFQNAAAGLVQKALGRTIKINEKGKNHAITIGYSDNEDLEKLLKILCGDTFFDNI